MIHGCQIGGVQRLVIDALEQNPDGVPAAMLHLAMASFLAEDINDNVALIAMSLIGGGIIELDGETVRPGRAFEEMRRNVKESDAEDKSDAEKVEDFLRTINLNDIEDWNG